MVSEQATMKEAIEEMTGKGFGITTVVDGGAASSGSSPTATCAASSSPTGPPARAPRGGVHDHRPKMIGGEELATRALSMMEGRITSLVIPTRRAGPPG